MSFHAARVTSVGQRVGWLAPIRAFTPVFDGLWARNPPAEFAASPDGGLRRFAPNPPYELSHNPAAVKLEVGEVGIAESGLQRFDDAIAHEDAALDAGAHPEIRPCPW